MRPRDYRAGFSLTSLRETLLGAPEDWYRRKYIREKEAETEALFYQFPKNCIIDGYWQGVPFFKYISQDLKSELNREKQQADNCVAVHFRGGDYIDEPETNQYHGLPGEVYYQRALEYVTNQIPDAEFHLFSDSPEKFQYPFLEKFPCQWVEEQDEVLAMERLLTYRHFVLANSSFSWWPAWQNTRKNSIVIAPLQWYRFPKLRDYSPALEEWIKL